MRLPHPKERRSRHRSSPSSREKRFGTELPKDFPWALLSAVKADSTEWLPEDDGKYLDSVIRSRDINRLGLLGKAWSLQSMSSHVAESNLTECKVKLLLSSVIKKYQFEGNRELRRTNALKKVLEAEALCSSFNKKGYKGLFTDGTPTKFLLDMKEFVERTIGYFPPDWCSLTEWSRHGPGSDTGSLGGAVSSYFKYVSWPYPVTRLARDYAIRLISNDQRWLGALENSYREHFDIPKYGILNRDLFWTKVLRVVEGNRITTVPKDGQIDRPIAIEPRMNLMLQLGVDGFIRKRLKRWGVNLNSQEKNQALAYIGSLNSTAESPCTLDLSNASDSVSLRIMKLTFPAPWFKYLCDIRSPIGRLPDGQRLRYSKLSSMGNGYTFAIESLLFAAICYAAERHVYGSWQRDITVIFGDDIIVPLSAYELTSTLLKFCGFTVNQEKSFSSPGIRESCGTDWIRGQLVRPVYLKEVPTDIRALYAIRNKLFRWFSVHLNGEISNIDSYIRRFISPKDLFIGPISDDEFDSYWHSAEKGQYEGSSFFFKCIICRPLPYKKCNEFLFRKLMHQLRGTTDEGPENPWCRRPRGGSVFTVSLRNRERLSVCTRRTPIWRDEYWQPIPSLSPERATKLV